MSGGSITPPISTVREGTNTIAIEVHQSGGTSSHAWFSLASLEATTDYQPLSFASSERSRSYVSNSWTVTENGDATFNNLLAGFRIDNPGTGDGKAVTSRPRGLMRRARRRSQKSVGTPEAMPFMAV